jgi:hypothetical protein
VTGANFCREFDLSGALRLAKLASERRWFEWAGGDHPVEVGGVSFDLSISQ